ncbi:hypothetical protein GA0115259_108175, partial [Streptomyces sp. MnatMP-M17]
MARSSIAGRAGFSGLRPEYGEKLAPSEQEPGTGADGSVLNRRTGWFFGLRPGYGEELAPSEREPGAGRAGPSSNAGRAGYAARYRAGSRDPGGRGSGSEEVRVRTLKRD